MVTECDKRERLEKKCVKMGVYSVFGGRNDERKPVT